MRVNQHVSNNIRFLSQKQRSVNPNSHNDYDNVRNTNWLTAKE